MKIKIYIRELTSWLLANLLLPLIAPLLIVYLCSILAGFVCEIDLKVLTELSDIFIDKGIYSFLSISTLLSLFLDYKIATNVIKGIGLLGLV